MRSAFAKASIATLLLIAFFLPAGIATAGPPLSLTDAVLQAIEANLDLAAQSLQLAADREEIDIVRSNLLPQIDVGARVQHLEDERSGGNQADSTQKSLTLAAKLSQMLYDEDDWANFGIQKHIYDGQQAQFDSFRLGLVQDAASAFLELSRARVLLGVREHNRELTASNLETSKARIAAGWSSQREVLRWEAQLASNDTEVADARTQVLVNRFQLNRVRNQPAEAPITPLPARIEEYGFVYASKPILEASRSLEGDRRLRDLLVQVGLARSPELITIDAAIAAGERLLASNRRAFFIPSLGVDASIIHVAADDRSSGQSTDTDDTEWTVGATLAFPLLQGGAKFASFRQTRESLSSLRVERRSSAQTIDQNIRAAFAEASGAWSELGFTKRQETAARRNYELVNDSYVLGVASILALLDAQSQLLTAGEALTNARYDFLEALIVAEEQMALYPFLEPEPEMTELLDRFERELNAPP